VSGAMPARRCSDVVRAMNTVIAHVEAGLQHAIPPLGETSESHRATQLVWWALTRACDARVRTAAHP
jgi:hypothetical protein